MQEKLNKYSEFINILTKNLDAFFENQKDFIKCKAGCSLCCRSGLYPLTNLEYGFLKLGFNKLEKEKQDKINQKCFEIYKERRIFIRNGNEQLDFSYKCPFLFDNLCSLYESRPLICRVHGLITIGLKEGKNYNMPGCLDDGLNYSEVWDEELKDFSLEKATALNIKSHPEVFDVGYEPLLKKFEHIGFGDIRMMFEWFIMDVPDYQKHLDEINKNF